MTLGGGRNWRGKEDDETGCGAQRRCGHDDALSCIRAGWIARKPNRLDPAGTAREAARLGSDRNPKTSNISAVSWSWMANWQAAHPPMEPPAEGKRAGSRGGARLPCAVRRFFCP